MIEESDIKLLGILFLLYSVTSAAFCEYAVHAASPSRSENDASLERAPRVSPPWRKKTECLTQDSSHAYDEPTKTRKNRRAQ